LGYILGNSVIDNLRQSSMKSLRQRRSGLFLGSLIYVLKSYFLDLSSCSISLTTRSKSYFRMFLSTFVLNLQIPIKKSLAASKSTPPIANEDPSKFTKMNLIYSNLFWIMILIKSSVYWSWFKWSKRMYLKSWMMQLLSLGWVSSSQSAKTDIFLSNISSFLIYASFNLYGIDSFLKKTCALWK